MQPVQIKRIYEAPSREDGYRILVDRLWPRGIKKEEAAIDEWLKEIAPSTELRKWFGHEAELWEEFCSRYQKELNAKGDLLEHLQEKRRHGTVTLLFSARETRYNHAALLRDILLKQ